VSKKKVKKKCSSILFTIFFLISIINSLLNVGSGFCQFSKSAVIIGELWGRVDPDDLLTYIDNGYYPVFNNGVKMKLNLEKKTPDEVVFRIKYSDKKWKGHPKWIVFRFFKSERSLAAAIITDQIDFAITESDEIAEEIDKSTKSIYIRHRFKKPNYVKMLAFNNKHQILKSKKVRKALTLAIDRKYIHKYIFRTQAFYADGPISKESKNYASSIKGYKHNPKQALLLLRQEKWYDENKDGILEKNGIPFKVSIVYEKGVLLEEQIARSVKIDWNKLGVDVITIPLTKKEIKRKLARRNYDVILMGYQFEDNFSFFKKVFSSKSQFNFLGYRNSTTDKYIKLYPNLNASSKLLMFHAIQNQISKDYPAAFLFFPWLERFLVNTSKFTNYRAQNKKLLPIVYWKFR